MNDQEPIHQEEQPPIGGTWRRLYTAVLVVLVIYIVVFWIFTKVYE